MKVGELEDLVKVGELEKENVPVPKDAIETESSDSEIEILEQPILDHKIFFYFPPLNNLIIVMKTCILYKFENMT